MGFILSITFFFVSFVSYVTNGKKITHAFIFPLLWGVIMLAESIHLFGLYRSNGVTYLVIFIGVVSFSIGSLLFKNVFPRSIYCKHNVEYAINTRIFLVFFIITIILLFYPMILNISAMTSGTSNMEIIRRTFTNLYSNIVLRLLYNYIALPFSIACLPIVAVMLVSDYSTRTKVTFFVLTLVAIVEKIFIDAGRGILLYFFVMIFFAYKLFLPKDVSKRTRTKIKKTVLAVFVGVFFAYLLITIARGGSFESLARQIYTYICGCVPFLDGNLQSVNQSRQFLYGTGGFHGLFQLVFTMLENLGIPYPGFMTQADAWYNASLAQRAISNTDYFNAYATAFYNVYLDGGLIAVFIEMLSYGAASRFILNKVKCEPHNYRIKAIYVLLLYGIVFSFIRFQFSLARNVLAYIFIVLIIKKGKIKEC